MIYGYIRVSTDKQNTENQRFEIKKFCDTFNMKVDKWVVETVSGVQPAKKRKLGGLLRRMVKNDILICTEISRLGRSLNQCMQKEIQVWTIKDNYRLGSDISSKVLAFAFGISAEIERNLISQRTKEALARKRAEGAVLGRPKGKPGPLKLVGREDDIHDLMRKGFSLTLIARILRVHRTTLSKFVNRKMLYALELRKTTRPVVFPKPVPASDRRASSINNPKNRLKNNDRLFHS